MAVEHQIAIIYCGTKGLLQKVPLKSVIDFQTEFLHHLDEYHKDVLETLRAGNLTDDALKTLEKTAREIAGKYEK
jgi:F-type H+/Na+-transporting ATPase subunit alpha